MEAASGALAVVSVTIQLTENIQKLVGFCKAVRNAPKDVKDQLDELQTLSMCLAMNAGGLTENPHSFDPLVERAVQECNNELVRLRDKLSRSMTRINSSDSLPRRWAAVKMAFNKPEIEEMRNSLDRAKSTLSYIEIKSTSRSIDWNLQRQEQLIQNFLNTVDERMTNLIVKNAIQEQIAGRREPPVECDQSLPSRIGTSASQVESGQSISTTAIDESLAGNRLNTTQPSVSRTQREYRDFKRSWFFIHTFLGTIHTTSWNRKAISTNSSGRRGKDEQIQKLIITPSRLLSLFGLAYGASIEARYTTGWQFNIQPFNLVPDNAPIFKFCRDGDIDGVRALLKLGQASIRDRDTRGRTPLWVASEALQVEVADLLLHEGADVNAGDWFKGRERSPLLAIATQYTQDLDASKKALMISTFERYNPGGYDADMVFDLIVKVILFYRPTKKYIKMSAQDRRDSLMSVIGQLVRGYCFDDQKTLSAISHGILSHHYDQNVLHWIMRTFLGMIAHEGCERMIHDAMFHKLLIVDSISMKLITRKTTDLHYRWDPGLKYSGYYQSFTPTTIALYQPAMFTIWRDILVAENHNIEAFVRSELVDSPLSDDGWNEITLQLVFKSNVSPEIITTATSDTICGRCGGTGRGFRPHVHLPWRRHLRAIRNGLFNSKAHSASFPSVDLGVQYPTPWEFVCADWCDDGFCVAWMYENDLADNEKPYGPDKPPYKSEEENSSQEKAAATAAQMEMNDCPVKNIPGAFPGSDLIMDSTGSNASNWVFTLFASFAFCIMAMRILREVQG